MTRPVAASVAAVSAGGALGALLRWALGEALTDGAGFPWTTFGINVAGAFALAVLVGVVTVDRSPLLAVALGPGLLGGFTTLSTYAEQGRALLADGQGGLALAYWAGTLLAATIAVAVAAGLTRRTA